MPGSSRACATACEVTKPLRLDEAAERELFEAVRRYEAERAGLGRQLKTCVKEALDQLCESPEACSLVSGIERHVLRSIRVPRFPYRVFFVDWPGEVLVLAIAHVRRRPAYWRTRLKGHR